MKEPKGHVFMRNGQPYARLQFVDAKGKKRDLWRKCQSRIHAKQVLRALVLVISVTALLVWGAARSSRKTPKEGQRSFDQGNLQPPKSGSFEYWADGDRFRVVCETDPKLQLLTDTDSAYDGDRYFYLDRHTGLLSYKKTDDEKSFSALPNPFFLPVDFLSNDGDDCPFCKLRLKEFHAASPRWDHQKNNITLRSKGKEQASQLDFTEVELPGDVIQKKAHKFRVRFTSDASGGAQPTKIERILPSDKPISSIEFYDFTSTLGGQFPKRIKIQVFDEQSNLAMQVDYQVQVIQINEPVDQSIFTIKDSEAEGVWDSDGRSFIKEKPLKKKPLD